MKRRRERRAVALTAAVVVSVMLGVSAGHAATFLIVNNDSSGEGFNDPAPRAPVGGNTGTTLGQQRLIALQFAADVWGAKLQSSVTIRIRSNFDPLSCAPLQATLGHAGPSGIVSSFSGAPISNTWYPIALANGIAGSDLSPAGDDIQATFSSLIDTGCFLGATNGFYYGLDGNPGASQLDLIPAFEHELCHGLGFVTFVDLASGAKLLGLDDVFMLNLEDHRTGVLYPNMTNAERVAASTSNRNLHWVGSNVDANSGILTAGKKGTHVRMYAPATLQPGASVSHFATSLAPDELMEPFLTPNAKAALATQSLQDIGWMLAEDSGFIPPDPDTLACEEGAAKNLRKFRACVETCHIHAATAVAAGTFFDEELCEADQVLGCRAAYNATMANLVATGTCPACLGATQQLLLATRLEAALDASTGDFYCSGSFRLGSDDPGFVDATTLPCEKAAAKNAKKLAKCIQTCHINAAHAAAMGAAFDEEACENDPATGCRATYDARAAALVATGTCPACLSAARQSALADQIEADIDHANYTLYCAGTIPLPD